MKLPLLPFTCDFGTVAILHQSNFKYNLLMMMMMMMMMMNSIRHSVGLAAISLSNFLNPVLNRSLDGPNARMGRARSLDRFSSEWAWPMYSSTNLVNGNEAHSLDKTSSEWVDRQAYGPTHWLDKLSSEWDRGPLTRQHV